MNGDLVQVLGVLTAFMSLVVAAAPVLRAWRRRHTTPNPTQAALAALETRWRDERSARERAEWERDELRTDVARLEAERAQWSAWQRKAEEYDALELEIEALKSDFDARLDDLANIAQRAQGRLDLVRRDVPGVRDYLAALHAESAHPPPAAQTAGDGGDGNGAGGASAGGADVATPR